MDNVEKVRVALARMEKAMANAEPTDVFKNVSAKIANMPQLDEALLRRQRDWGIIANYVVGAEPK